MQGQLPPELTAYWSDQLYAMWTLVYAILAMGILNAIAIFVLALVNRSANDEADDAEVPDDAVGVNRVRGL